MSATSSVIFTAQAEAQIDALHAYVEERSGELPADRYVSRIVDYCLNLATFPKRGSMHDDLIPGLRMIGFEGRVTILFTVQESQVLIEGIYYGGQDWSAAFDTD